MQDTLNDLVATLDENAKGGISLTDKTVRRALAMDPVREKIQGLLDKNFPFVSAAAQPCSDPTRAKVIFRFGPSPEFEHSATPVVIANFESATNRFLSVTEAASDSVSDNRGFGALPFALAAPSFAQAASTPATDPLYIAMSDRRQRFTEALAAQGSTELLAVPGTPVNTDQDTKYGTSEKSTGDGSDYDTAEDTCTDHEYDIQEDPDNS
jgi:hypothetical protein